MYNLLDFNWNIYDPDIQTEETIQSMLDNGRYNKLIKLSNKYEIYYNGVPMALIANSYREGLKGNDAYEDANEAFILTLDEMNMSDKAKKKREETLRILEQENIIKLVLMLKSNKETEKIYNKKTQGNLSRKQTKGKIRKETIVGTKTPVVRGKTAEEESKQKKKTQGNLKGKIRKEDKDDSDKKNIRTATYLSSVDELNSFYKEFGRGNDNFGKKVLRDNMIDIYNKSIKERLKKKQKEREKLESKKSIGKAGKTKTKHDKTKLTKEIKSIKNELLKQENKSQSIKLGKTFITLNKAEQNIESGNYELNIKNATMRRTIMAE
jgi:hypothetical protein